MNLTEENLKKSESDFTITTNEACALCRPFHLDSVLDTFADTALVVFLSLWWGRAMVG